MFWQVSEYGGYMTNLLNVKDLPARPRILCWVLTSPGDLVKSQLSLAFSW